MLDAVITAVLVFLAIITGWDWWRARRTRRRLQGFGAKSLKEEDVLIGLWRRQMDSGIFFVMLIIAALSSYAAPYINGLIR